MPEVPQHRTAPVGEAELAVEEIDGGGIGAAAGLGGADVAGGGGETGLEPGGLGEAGIDLGERLVPIEVKLAATGILFREGESWVAYCEGLDLSSFGATQDEALAAVQQAIRLFIESCISRGTLEQALSELGWACQTPDGRLADCRTQRLPPPFMIEAVTRQGTHWSQPIRFGE